LLPVVGALESDGFHDQAAQLARAWGPDIVRPLLDLPGCDHLSACDALAQPGSALFVATQALLRAS
jgi:hypothetical protein